MTERYSLDDLRYLMRRLREPNGGCPWDLKQDFLSITPSTIEEAYEVVEAIETGNRDEIREELGDLLFQIIFYSQLGEEENSFSLDDIVHGLTAKLVRRHPHVFPEGTLASRQTSTVDSDTIKLQWEAIKAEERKNKGKVGALDDIPRGLPAVTRAIKIQKRAARMKFDWSCYNDVVEKLQEELAELNEAIELKEAAAIEEELGDVLFTVVNMSRHLGVEPEAALRRSNEKFSTRFEAVIELADVERINLAEADDLTLDDLWRKAKNKTIV